MVYGEDDMCGRYVKDGGKDKERGEVKGWS